MSYRFIHFPRLLLAVGLLGFHFGAAEAPSEAEADVAAVGGALADGGVVGVEAAAASTNGAEHIGHVEEQRQSTVEEVFAKSEVKVWECRNCGHIVVGTQAPEVCPVCNHPQAYFEINKQNY